MIYTENTKKAMIIAYKMHQNQVDKVGIPYIYHPIHIAEQMDDEDSTVVALLHDVIEDTNMCIDDLRNIGLNDNVLEALSCITHDNNQDYFTYIEKISKNPLAAKVKIADLKHNLDNTRLNKVTEKDTIRNKKYKKALEILQNNRHFIKK